MVSRTQLRILIGIYALSGSLLCAAGEDIWIEVKSPNFTVISNASAKNARRVAKTLEQFRSIFKGSLPDLNFDPGAPLLVFATRDEKSLKAHMPNDRQEKGALQPAGIFLSGPEEKLILLRADTSSDEGYHTIYHEYVHMVMRLNFPSLPLWLSEGLAELFGFATVLGERPGFGKLSPAMIEMLKTISFIPLPTLMTVTHDSPYYRQENKARIFYAQSCALVSYLALSSKQTANQLNEFLRLLQTDISEQEAVQKAFGDLRVLQGAFERYVRFGAFKYSPAKTRISDSEERYTERTLTPVESLAARGGLLVHTDRLDEARSLLEQALQLDSHNAGANEGMGMLLLRVDNPEQALKHFAAAAGSDSKSFLAQYYAGQSAYRRNKDYEAAEKYLRRALEINPRFGPAYRMLSYILLMQTTRLPEALELAVKAVNLEPGDLSHRLNVGDILMEMEKYDDARRVAESAFALAKTDSERSQADSLLFAIRDNQERSLAEKREAEALKETLKKMEEEHRASKESEEQRRPQIAMRDQPAGRPAAKIETGPAGKVTGLIRSVKCEFPAIMDLVLETSGKQQKFRAQNYYQVQYGAIGKPGKNDFEPCEELQGKFVQVDFLNVSGEEFSGLIKSIIIEK